MSNAIGLDIGHSSVKIAAGAKHDLFPSAAVRAIDLVLSEAKTAAKDDTVAVDGRSYFVGNTALVHSGGVALDGLSDGWIETHEHLALLTAGYRRGAAIVGSDAILALGLPSRLHDQQRKRLVELAALNVQIPKERVMVLPQALAAYMAVALNSEGQPANGFDVLGSRWGVIDVGYYTADFGLIHGGQWSAFAAKSAPGASSMATSLQAIIAADHKVNLSLRDCDAALAVKSTRLYGQMVDLTEAVDEIAEDYAQSLADHAGQVFGQSLPTLDAILLVGGGASVVSGRLRKLWPQAKQIEGVPMRFAVAEGLRRYGEMAARMHASKGQ